MTNENPKFQLELKPTPPPPESKYHQFRHFMYRHLHNKYIMAVVLGAIALIIVVVIGYVIKHLG